MPYTVDPLISIRQTSERFGLRMILFGNNYSIRHFVSFIWNSAFRVRKVYFFCFTTKHCLTIKFASFNRMLKFADTPLQQKLSFTFCFTSLISVYKHPDFPNHFQFTSKDWPRFTASAQPLKCHRFFFKNVLLNQENWIDSHSVVVYLPKSKVILKRIIPYKPCQIKSKPKAREENKKNMLTHRKCIDRSCNFQANKREFYK